MLRRHSEPTVSWLELLQDLVIVVFAMTLFSGLQFSWGTAWMVWYAAAIVIVYGSWIAWVLVNNRFPARGLPGQLLTMVWIVAALIVAPLTLWEAPESEPAVMNAGMALAFLALTIRYAMTARSHPEVHRAAWAAAGFSGAAVLILTTGALLPASAYTTIIVGPALALIGLVVVYSRMLPASAPLNYAHLSERMGQFLLILLGDTFLEIVLNIERGGFFSVEGIVLAAAAVFLLWRAYFQHVMPAGPPTRTGALQRWVMAHLLLVVSLGMTSTIIAAQVSYLPLDYLEAIEAFSEDVWLLLALALTYASLAIVQLASGQRDRRVVAILISGAAVFFAGHLIWWNTFVTWQVGAIIIAVMLAVEIALSRAERNRASV